MSELAEALVAAQAELPCALGKDADLYVVGVCPQCDYELTGVDEERDRREARYDPGAPDRPGEGTEA